VSFEGPAEEALAAKAVDSLNRALDRICAVLNTYPTGTIPVVLYTAEQFSDITRAPSWAAGAYDGTIRVPMRGALDEEQELDRVLAHEFTHALVHTLAKSAIPTWLNEGLATALETDDLGWAERSVERSQPVPLSVLRRSFGQLSGGQAQLVALASVLALRPAYLILDEPTSQLDPQGTRLVGEALARLVAGSGAGVLLTEHKTDLLWELAGRVVVLDGGRMALSGAAREVLADERLPAWGVEPPARVHLARAAEAAGVVLPELAA